MVTTLPTESQRYRGNGVLRCEVNSGNETLYAGFNPRIYNMY